MSQKVGNALLTYVQNQNIEDGGLKMNECQKELKERNKARGA